MVGTPTTSFFLDCPHRTCYSPSAWSNFTSPVNLRFIICKSDFHFPQYGLWMTFKSLSIFMIIALGPCVKPPLRPFHTQAKGRDHVVVKGLDPTPKTVPLTWSTRNYVTPTSWRWAWSKSWNIIINSLTCRNPCRLFIHDNFFGLLALSPSSVKWTWTVSCVKWALDNPPYSSIG